MCTRLKTWPPSLKYTYAQSCDVLALAPACLLLFFNSSPRVNIFQSNNQFSTSCWIRQTVSNRLELDQKLMLNAIPQQQVLNTNLISVSRGQTSAWCLSQPELPAGGKQQQQQQQQHHRMHGKQSSSQNWGHSKCTAQDCDILPSRDNSVQLVSTYVSLTIP